MPKLLTLAGEADLSMPCGCYQNGALQASRFRQKNPYLERSMKNQHTKLWILSLIPVHQALRNTEDGTLEVWHADFQPWANLASALKLQQPSCSKPQAILRLVGSHRCTTIMLGVLSSWKPYSVRTRTLTSCCVMISSSLVWYCRSLTGSRMVC